MKIVGLITEYNPFHNGHRYHIETAKKMTGADAAVVVMSGNFVQRGTPAIMPKHLRAEAALRSGASLVIELPVCYATGSAEYFALGAVSLLEKLGCVDSLCFGSECGEISILEQLAEIICEEPEGYRTRLRSYLRDGCSFPLARQRALKEYLNDHSLDNILEQPNNILGIEYLKALYKLKSSITPVTIARRESGYHDTELAASFSSASAIRRTLLASGTHAFSELADHVPSSCFHILEQTQNQRYPVLADDFSLLLKYRLLGETKESLYEYMDISKDLAHRIINQRNHFVGFEQFCDLLKTKDMTYSRISRALIHLLSDIRKSDLEAYCSHGYHAYIRVLGFRKDSTEILTKIKEASALPLLTKVSGKPELPGFGKKMLETDLFAADLYESVITDKFHTPFINELQQSIIRI